MTEAHKNATVLTRAPDIEETSKIIFLISQQKRTVKTLNIGTPRPATVPVVVLNIKQFNFTRK